MRTVCIAVAAALLFVVGGCHHHNLACNSCSPQGGVFPDPPTHVGRLPHHGQIGSAGPPTAAYAYPYYTVRAPRDFLMDDPPTIGR